jgi:hypothetical protein
MCRFIQNDRFAASTGGHVLASFLAVYQVRLVGKSVFG